MDDNYQILAMPANLAAAIRARRQVVAYLREAADNTEADNLVHPPTGVVVAFRSDETTEVGHAGAYTVHELRGAGYAVVSKSYELWRAADEARRRARRASDTGA